MSKTLFIDFDGVIRHWGGQDISTAENQSGVPAGSFYGIAFAPELLNLAITGVLSHTQWTDQIAQIIAHQYGQAIAKYLISVWSQACYRIDHAFLDDLRVTLPQSPFVLVTNATSKLTADLETAALTECFEEVINSSEIGFAKPDPAFFRQALARAQTLPQESIYIDDSVQNIDAARALGLNACLHITTADTLAFIRALSI